MTSIWLPLPDFENSEGPSDSVDTFQFHTPFSIFNYLFSDEIMYMLVKQTNLYSFQRSQEIVKPYTQTQGCAQWGAWGVYAPGAMTDHWGTNSFFII